MSDDSGRAAPFLFIPTQNSVGRIFFGHFLLPSFYSGSPSDASYIKSFYFNKSVEKPINKAIKGSLTLILCPSNRVAVQLILLLVKRNKNETMAIKATMEILGTRDWDMAPDILHYYKRTVDNSILLRAHFDKSESDAGVPFLASSADGFDEKLFVGDVRQMHKWIQQGWENGDTIVSVLPVVGPIIRNGDACSFGSKNYRDFLMAASEVPGCVGHLVYIDTPGGSAYAKNDFQYAIDYVRAKGQPVIALVDGLCASAGMALASMCDEIYFMNPLDQVGSIGTMCAFYAIKNGVENAITHETFVEVYGSKSEWKNKEYRDAAEGKYDELQKHVDELNEQFHALVKKYRPQVQEEQMHGKVYNCGDVIGTLVDGQGTMQSCIDRILELAGVQAVTASAGNGGEAAPAASDNQESQSAEVPEATGDFTGEDPTEGVQVPSQDDDVAVAPAQEAVITSEETTTETIHNNNPEEETTNEPVVPNSSEGVSASQTEERKMKEYPLIMSALGLNALEVDKEGGYYMNEALCDAMEAFVAKADQYKLTMDAKINEVAKLNARIEELKGEHEQAINGLNEAHAQEIEKLNADHAASVQSLTEQKDGEIAELNNKVNEANATIEGLNQQVASKEAEITELSETVVAPEVPQAPTADGVQTVEAPAFENKSVINDDMSPNEKKEALRKRNEELAKLIG